MKKISVIIIRTLAMMIGLGKQLEKPLSFLLQTHFLKRLQTVITVIILEQGGILLRI